MNQRKRKARIQDPLYPENNPDSPENKKRSKIQAKLECLLWVLIAGALGYYLEFFQNFLKVTHGISFYLSISCLFIFFGIFIHVSYIRPWRTKTTVDFTNWERDIPYEVGIATVFGLIGFFSMVSMFWPFYHIGSLVIVFIEWIGFVSLISLY